ncbi:MAG TPA: energy transducer TonB [Bryobacteraceae bacterium]|nr:energy transducer TonB [Bryobacteraceae bacterium]
MTESTARAALFELQSSMGPSYTWAIPQKPVSVRIPFPVIDRLEHEAVENFRSLSSRGSEIGGLLFGTVNAGQPAVVTIEEFELISCDYSRGPLYRLAEADMARFDRAIQQRGTASPLTVVGMFRSHTRKTLSLDADDLAFLDARFKESYQIALLIRPFATKASTAGIFMRENGVFPSDTSLLEFPFRSSLLSSEKPAEAPETKAASPAPAAPAASTSASKATVRGQIVPIASRRDTPSMTLPSESAAAEEAPVTQASAVAPAPPVVEPPQPAPKAPQAPGTPPQAAAPQVQEKPKPTVEEKPKPQVDDKASKPKVEDKPVVKAKTEEKAAVKPSVEDKTAKPKVEDKGAAKPKTEDKAPASKPKVEEKAAVKPKVEEPARPKFEEKPAAKVAAAPVAAVVIPEPEPQGSKKLLWMGVGVVAAVILLIAGFIYPGFFHHKTTPATQDTSALSLRVERTAGEILLTWNRDSDAIRTATHAVLVISDGDQHENVEMDLAQLRNGSISYSPATSDVIFRMEVTGRNNEKTASESVRVLRTRPSPLTPDSGAPQQAAANPATPNTPANSKTPTPANNTPAPNTPNSTTPNQPTAGQPNNAATNTPAPEDAPKTPERPLKAFQAPTLSARLHPTNPADLPDAPSLSSGAPAGPSSVTGLNMNSVSAPVAPKPATPAPAPPAATTTSSTPTATKSTPGGNLVQAQLVSKKDPEYPKLARETGAKGIVELVATIGADGKVKAVKVVKGPPMLLKAASDAVMQWRYKPTMLNGVPVESQTQVFVNFLGGDR